eukprot:835712-Ditylum_brightwellii.AAC.1
MCIRDSRVTRVGRGWLAESGAILLTDMCETSIDCATNHKDIKWRGNVGQDIVYSSVIEMGLHGEASTFTIPAVREQDGKEYMVVIAASRFFDEGGSLHPLVNIISDETLQPDATHGARFWIPYELNEGLPRGTYKSVPDALSIEMKTSIGQPFADLYISLEFTATTRQPSQNPTASAMPSAAPSPLAATESVDLTGMQ